ncbi:cation diffusion facilitator family transporter [archaeon]|nr:cation diffusion facilitator family transporter [archaeon]
MEDTEKQLKIVIAFTGFILIVEVIGGVISNSLALLSDAAHVFSDVIALTFSFLALRLAMKPASTSRTFGYHRAEVFAALANGIILLVVSLFIFKEAYVRLSTPPEIKTTEMLLVAVFGLLVNLWVALRLRGHAHDDLNIKSAFLHVVGDALASLGVIVGAIVIIFTGNTLADPIVSVLIGSIIIVGSLRVTREAVYILFESTPRDVDLEHVSSVILGVPGVKSVHDLHIWSICSHINAASAHINVGDMKMSEVGEISKTIEDKMGALKINHTTFQFECSEDGGSCDINHG